MNWLVTSGNRVAAGALLLLAASTVVGLGAPAAFAQPLAASAAPVEMVQGWQPDDARAVLKLVAQAGDEGLDPADYDQEALARAIEGGAGGALDAAATRSALLLARDYWLGHVADRGRFGWRIARSDAGAAALPAQLQDAVRAGQAQAWLHGLLPQDARYAALQAAYVAAPDTDHATRDRLRANLERLRWLPRDLGQNYVFVNIPSYRLAVMEAGAEAGTYDVVVGSPDTPTPMLQLTARSVVVNPWWSVPPSIVRRTNLRPSAANAARGFVFTRAGVRQKPGPLNALGRVKIDMPNPDAIYLHSTDAPALFARDDRALSHGCIRVKDIEGLAEQLMGDEAAPVQTALDASTTRTFALPHKWPVYLVYLTADVDASGKVVSYGDPYNQDEKVAAALGGATQVAAR